MNNDCDQSVENLYYCKELLETILDNWMGIFPLWSGLVLGDLKRYDKTGLQSSNDAAKTRDTNCLVENYFGIVKMDIPKRKRLRPGDFIRKQYIRSKGKLSEIGTLIPSTDTKKKALKNDQEQWKPKQDRSKKKSVYFTPPLKFPQPKKTTKRKLVFDEKDSKRLKPCDAENVEKIKDCDDPDDPDAVQFSSFKVKKRKCEPEERKLSLLENVPSWGGEGFHRNAQVNLTNTCPLDNLLVVFHVIFKQTDSGKLLLTEDSQLKELFNDIYHFMEKGDWFHARMKWIDSLCPEKAEPSVTNNVLTLDLYSSEFELVIKYLASIQGSEQISRCSEKNCPLKYSRRYNPEIHLR